MSKRPTTIAEARKYRYGAWAGRPQGNPYQEGRCIVEVFEGSRGAMHHQCCNRVQNGTPYCGTHRPGAKEERAARRPSTKFEREMARLDLLHKQQNEHRRFGAALKKIAAQWCSSMSNRSCSPTCAHSIARRALKIPPPNPAKE